MIHTPTAISIFFFNDTATTEIYTLSLHDALPIWAPGAGDLHPYLAPERGAVTSPGAPARPRRSEEHTSELQSQSNLVCRLLLEKKKQYFSDIGHMLLASESR